MTFLAEAGTVLAGSIDYNQTFESVARLVVPKLADFCIIDHMDESGTLRQVAVAHSDPEKESILRALRYSEPGEYQHAALRVFQSSRPGIRNKLDVRGIEKLFTEPLLEAVKQLKPTSYVALPCRPPRERG